MLCHHLARRRRQQPLLPAPGRLCGCDSPQPRESVPQFRNIGQPGGGDICEGGRDPGSGERARRKCKWNSAPPLPPSPTTPPPLTSSLSCVPPIRSAWVWTPRLRRRDRSCSGSASCRACIHTSVDTWTVCVGDPQGKEGAAWCRLVDARVTCCCTCYPAATPLSTLTPASPLPLNNLPAAAPKVIPRFNVCPLFQIVNSQHPMPLYRHKHTNHLPAPSIPLPTTLSTDLASAPPPARSCCRRAA